MLKSYLLNKILEKMKITNFFYTMFIVINVCTVADLKAQTNDSIGLPGDNLDLYGVLDLFKKSENPEEFEKKLNSSETKLNNLDLNGDGETDYIRVIDHSENNLHALVLQIPINEDESQDVAVIEIEKKDDGTAHLQIVGDEELYGKNYIVEPAETNKNIPESPSQQSNNSTTEHIASSNSPVIINVWTWPSVRYVYAPVYMPWVSPWRWRYYPPYWRPWRPIYWSVYHPYWHPYRAYYRRDYHYRIVPAHDMYYSHRVVSKTVYQRRTQPTQAPVQQRPRRTTEQRTNHRQQNVQPRQPRSSTPRSTSQPRKNTPRGGGRTNGSSGPRK